ncbi:hypothetical protein ABG067_005565 [Albugo candida]
MRNVWPALSHDAFLETKDELHARTDMLFDALNDVVGQQQSQDEEEMDNALSNFGVDVILREVDGSVFDMMQTECFLFGNILSIFGRAVELTDTWLIIVKKWLESLPSIEITQLEENALSTESMVRSLVEGMGGNAKLVCGIKYEHTAFCERVRKLIVMKDNLKQIISDAVCVQLDPSELVSPVSTESKLAVRDVKFEAYKVVKDTLRAVGGYECEGKEEWMPLQIFADTMARCGSINRWMRNVWPALSHDAFLEVLFVICIVIEVPIEEQTHDEEKVVVTESEDITDKEIENTEEDSKNEVKDIDVESKDHEEVPAEVQQEAPTPAVEKLAEEQQDDKVDVDGLSIRAYLEQTVVPILLQGMSSLVKERPSNPVEWLAAYLIKNNPQTRDRSVVMAEESKTDATDVKPDDKKKSEAITIRVKDQSGEEMYFRVKLVTRMEKVFEAYAERKNIDVTALRFLLDGTRICGDQTPKMLELEDRDQIDCALEQVGGLK